MRRLEIQIENCDATLRTADNMAVIAVGVIYRYWRLGQDSVAVAQALGIKPPSVRVLADRLRKEATQALNFIVGN